MVFKTNVDSPFTLIKGKKNSSFGKFPIKEKINNHHDIFKGTTQYNPYNKYLWYSVGKMSYMSLYEFVNGDFKLKWEKKRSEVSYDIDNQKNLLISETPKYAPTSIALTKNYIVSIERDKNAIKPTVRKTRGRNFSRVPTTVFVYDYDMNLQKIIDCKMPVVRLASDGYSDDLYIISINPEFCIAKFSI